MLQQIIDRRLAGKNKSIGNRERFLRRYQGQVRDAVRKAVDKRGIRDIEQGEDIHLPKRDISEPSVRPRPGRRARDGAPRQPGVRARRPHRAAAGRLGAAAAAAGQAGDSGEGEDDFVFHLTKEEFMQIFFDDLALPRMTRTQLAETPEMKSHRAGYSNAGTPSNLSGDPLDARRDQPPRRDRCRLARRAAPRSRRAWLDAAGRGRSIAAQELAREGARSSRSPCLRARLERIPYLDPIDLRFRNRVRLPVPTAKAVMFCLMDVSGSMDEARKDLSKRFFILLYLFLTRHYEKIDIVFIRHHTQAQEVDEENFFRARETGGTVVSSALVLMDEIIKARYSPSDWNIYARAGQRRRQLAPRLRPLPRAADREPAAQVPLLRLRAGRRRGAEPVGGIRPPAGGAEALRDAEGHAGRRRSIRCSAISSRPKESLHDEHRRGTAAAAALTAEQPVP